MTRVLGVEDIDPNRAASMTKFFSRSTTPGGVRVFIVLLGHLQFPPLLLSTLFVKKDVGHEFLWPSEVRNSFFLRDMDILGFSRGLVSVFQENGL